MRTLLVGVSVLLLAQFALLLAYTPGRQQTAPAKPTYTAALLAATEKDEIRLAQKIRDTIGEELWPDFGKTAIPILLYNDAYEFLVAVQSAPPGWEAVARDDIDSRPYFRRALTKTSSFTAKINGEWVATMSCRDRMNRNAPAFLAIKEDYYAALILHEAFHAFQAQTSSKRFEMAMSSYTAEKGYPFKDQAFASAWNDEGGALAAAVSDKTVEGATASAKRFLALRDARRKIPSFTTAMLDFEREIEWLEGLGKYVETRAYEMAAGRSDLAGGNRFQPTPFSWSETVNLKSRLGQLDGDTRFYSSGNAQARLLDRLAPGWKQGALERGDLLEDLLRRAVAR